MAGRFCDRAVCWLVCRFGGLVGDGWETNLALDGAEISSSSSLILMVSGSFLRSIFLEGPAPGIEPRPPG